MKGDDIMENVKIIINILETINAITIILEIINRIMKFNSIFKTLYVYFGFNNDIIDLKLFFSLFT